MLIKALVEEDQHLDHAETITINDNDGQHIVHRVDVESNIPSPPEKVSRMIETF